MYVLTCFSVSNIKRVNITKPRRYPSGMVYNVQSVCTLNKSRLITRADPRATVSNDIKRAPYLNRGVGHEYFYGCRSVPAV